MECLTTLGGQKFERKYILDDFKHADLPTICTRDMFNEGVDIPDARLLVFLRSTSSKTIFEQQLGRGLRKHAGKDTVSVLDFVANIERIAMARELADQIREYSPREVVDRVENVTGGDGIDHTYFSRRFDFDTLSVNLLEKFDALKADTNKDWASVPAEEIIALALRLSPDELLGQVRMKELSRQRLFPNPSTIHERFGGLIKFQRACGFEVGNIFAEMTNEELIDHAKRLSPDRPLETKDLKRLSKEKEFVNPSTIYARFGSIREFQKACGFSLDYLEMSNEELVELALRFSPNKPLTVERLNELSRGKNFLSTPSIVERFGSVLDFQRACGFENLRSLSVKEI